jgi:hypothetical protein
MQKKFNKTKKLTKYTKKIQNYSKFEHISFNNVGRLNKAKKTKNIISNSPSACCDTQGRGLFPECQMRALREEGSRGFRGRNKRKTN